jgi:hypothetical protein
VLLKGIILLSTTAPILESQLLPSFPYKHFNIKDWRVPPKCRNPPTRLYGVTVQKTIIRRLIAMETSKFVIDVLVFIIIIVVFIQLFLECLQKQ